VNWCPKDKTALANEEVVGGLCERCGTPVEKRNIPQWYFRITDYAQRLIDDLDELDWPEGIKNQQRNWIGRSEGVEFDLKVAGLDGAKFRVFTTRIDTIFGMTFCVLAPEHPLVTRMLETSPNADAIRAYQASAQAQSEIDRTAEGRAKTGVDTGFRAINPANGQPVPIFIADYVLMNYGTGAIMAVPGHDQRDFDFARTLGVEILPVIAPTADGEADVLAAHARGEAFESKGGFLINSGEYTGLAVRAAQDSLGEWVEAHEIGERKVNYKLRDWLISRQRYWGCPIPIIHSAEGEEQLVPLGDLPVELPDVDHYEPGDDGSSPLARIAEFVNVTDRDGRLGRRETDTMGGFACSSWYFLRFCDPHNFDAAWSPESVAYWMPVDCYVGGAEHAVMHLLYARFWTKVLFDLGVVPVKEPFRRLMNQGQVLGNTPYRQPREGETLGVGDDGILISYAEAAEMDPADITWRWARMSKSKGNVVTPDEAVAEYGADALRIYELFVAPFDADVQWSNDGMQGAVRFLSRVMKLVHDHADTYNPDWRDHLAVATMTPVGENIRRATHRTLKKVTEDVERFAFNTAISSLMTFLNDLGDLRKDSDTEHEAWSEAIETLILMLAPFAPHCADEMWESLGYEQFTYDADWPKFSAELAAATAATIAVQVNGKLRETFDAPIGTSKEELEAAARRLPKVIPYLEQGTVRKVIVVPDKLVNIVIA
jgi:leucyl-tRNA synthetase